MDTGGGGGLNNNTTTRKSQLKPKSSVNEIIITSNYNHDDYNKKMLHRDLERQRRQEMATLYASLRSLLPLEYIKGYRAVSDHMNGAVNYIKNLQQRMEGLSLKRDELIRVDSEINSSSSYFNPSSVIVHSCSCGVEVVIGSQLRAQGLPLSRALQVILDQGLTVVSCVSTRVNERLLLYKIQVEMTNDLTGFDPCGLQPKLIEEEIRLWSTTEIPK